MSLPRNKNLLCEYWNPVFIETGTLKGAGLRAAARAGFTNLMSVDIDPDCVSNAKTRFPNANIFCGDSAMMLPAMIRQAGDQLITFWLDAHTHTVSPLMAELDAIGRQNRGHDTILIDDVRLFACCYGFTVCDVVAVLQTINRNYTVMLLDGHVSGDILAAVPPDVMETKRMNQKRTTHSS